MLDKKFIKRKITLIQNELDNLLLIKETTIDDILKDPVKLAAMERFLERVINRALDINQHIIAENSQQAPLTYKETFTTLANLGVYPMDFANEISKSVGTRNILIHEYDKIDNASVYHSVKDCLRDYNQYCQYILDYLQD